MGSKRRTAFSMGARFLLLLVIGVPLVVVLLKFNPPTSGREGGARPEEEARGEDTARPEDAGGESGAVPDGASQSAGDEAADAAEPGPAVAPAGGAGRELALGAVLEPDATVSVYHEQTRLVSGVYVFWGANWSWLNSDIALQHGLESGLPLTGGIAGLGVKVSGHVTIDAPNVYTYHFLLDAERDLSGIVGGGIEWRLAIPPPSLPGAVEKPVLLPDNRGWRWALGPGRVVEVAFQEPAPKVYFERGDVSRIRTMLIGEQLQAGRHWLAMTVRLPEGSQRIPSSAERYGAASTVAWHRDALRWDASPVDLSFLNHKPA
ncbi:MAG: hypothetical protein JXR94_16125, partial [Candidatus Hydrogenedentes bacterium]|nr:hypothetical protein [Candidatus Hydrogenedentota bacterium]